MRLTGVSGVCGPEAAHDFKAPCGRGAVLKRTVCGGLDDGTVGRGVGKRNPELQRIGAGGDERLENGERRVLVGVEEVHEGDEGALVPVGKSGKSGFKAVGHGVALSINRVNVGLREVPHQA